MLEAQDQARRIAEEVQVAGEDGGIWCERATPYEAPDPLLVRINDDHSVAG
jgi:hypothetical protein